MARTGGCSPGPMALRASSPTRHVGASGRGRMRDWSLATGRVSKSTCCCPATQPRSDQPSTNWSLMAAIVCGLHRPGTAPLRRDVDTWQSGEIGVRVFISADYQGGLWAASSHYVGHFDGNTWSHYSFRQSWPCSPAVDILADVGGGLWLSSYHCTLMGFNGEVWDEYDNGSRGDLLTRGPGGAVYAAQGSDIKRYDGTTWNRLPSIKVPHFTRVTAITVGPEGEVWVTLSASPNLILYRGNEWEMFPELVGKEITALLVDSQGDLWAGYSGGLLHYDGETWERIEREIPLSAINALAEDRQGRIWVGGRDGLSVYDPTKE